MAGEDLGAIRGKIEIEYDDRGVGKAKDSLGDLEGKGEKTTGAIAGFFGGMAAGIIQAVGALVVDVGRKIFSLVKDSITSFASFEQGMKEVFTLLPGISGDAMNKMTRQTLDAAKEMKVLPEEVVPALYSALSAGVPPDNVFDFLIQANKLAKGGVTDLDTAVSTMSATVNAYGADVISAEQVSDLLFTAVKGGITTVDELGASLSNVVPTAAGLGIEFGNVTAALATMTSQGTPTAQATTQLRQLMVELSKEGGAAAKTFEDIAGKSFRDFIAGGGNMQEALQLMEKAARDNDKSITDLFGSVEAGNAALQLTGAGAAKFTQELEASQNAAGATDEAFNTMSSGISDAWAEARVSLDVFIKKALVTLGPAIENAIRQVVAAFAFFQSDVIPVLVEVAQKFGEAAKFIEDNKTAFTVVAGVITAIYLPAILRSIAVTIAHKAVAVASWTAQRIAAIKSITVQSLGYYRVAAAAVVAGVASTVNAAKTVASWVVMGATATVNAARVATAWVIANAGALGPAVAAFAFMIARWAVLAATSMANAARVAAAWVVANAGAAASAGLMAATVVRFVAGWVLMGTQALLQAARVALAWLIAMGPIALIIAAVIGLVILIVKNWDTIWAFTKKVWEAIWNFLKGIWEFIVNAVTTYINFYKSIIKAGLDFIKNLWESIWNGIKSFFTSVWNGLTKAISTYINFYRTIISNGLNFIKTQWTNAWNTVKTVVSTIINVVRGVVQSGIDKVKSIIGGISAIIATVRNAFDNARKAASDKINAVISLVRELPNRAKNALGNLASKLYSSGRDLILGLINGIKDMAGRAASAAIDAVKGAIDGAKNFLGIGSPSKLARDVIGGPIMQGVAVGETKNADLPREALVRALSTLPKAVAPTVNAVVSGESGGSRAYNFGPGSITLDLSKMKSIDDVVRAVEGLKPTSRQFVSVRKP